MRLEQAPPPVLHDVPDPCSLQQLSQDNQDNTVLRSLDLVDNNNSTSVTLAVQPLHTNSNNTIAELEVWARNLERGVSPCTPEEDDEDDEEGGGQGRSSSSGVSEAEEEEARSSCCPSACSSTSSEASELANLASTSSSSSGGGSAGSECSSEDEQPPSPVPPFNLLTPQTVDDKTCSFIGSSDTKSRDESVMPHLVENKIEVAAINVPDVAITAPPVLIKPKPDKPRNKSNNNNCGASSDTLGAFDVFTMETALPKLDLAQLESHLLAAARSEDRRRRNDREEIRRRLAMGEETERPGGRKPSLQSRLQSGMNLQLCFMNETASEFEALPNQDIPRPTPPVAVPITLPKSTSMDPGEMQREAQMALAQASQMAHMEMALERHQMRLTATPSPTSQLLQRSLHKVGVAFPPERRRVSRQLLTDMNVTQLQVLVNDLHTLIEGLNEELVQLLMERDDLHMEQDSRLVDIEDLNRYLGAKSQPLPAGLHR